MPFLNLSWQLQSYIPQIKLVFLGRLSVLFRRIKITLPLKFIDSVLGGVFSEVNSGKTTYLNSTILVASPIALADKYITHSERYTYADTHLPNVAKDLNQEVAQLFNKLS